MSEAMTVKESCGCGAILEMTGHSTTVIGNQMEAFRLEHKACRAAPKPRPEICVCRPEDSFCGAWDCCHPSPDEQAQQIRSKYGPECRLLRGEGHIGPLCSCGTSCILRTAPSLSRVAS